MTTARMFDVDASPVLRDPAVWDEVVRAGNAPIFYRSQILRAYQRDPIEDTLACYYLTARAARSGRVEAVLPVFLVPATDPLGVLPHLFPGFLPADRPLLLSHIWHWYDTRVPAYRLDVGLIEAVCAALRALAADSGAQAFGFMNITCGSPLERVFAAAGLAPREIDARYTLDLRGLTSAGDYLAGLPRAARHDMRRQLRLAENAGAQITAGCPSAADILAVARLCQVSAAKHGNPGWYEPDKLSRFTGRLRRDIRLVAIRVAGQPVAASISFLDGTRFHNWAAGSVSYGELAFSPYAVLMYASVEAALAGGCTVLEGGRRNDQWKERFGLQRRPLCGSLTLV